ncbi:PmoA family protein [Candidatus Sumerlaeota bacterium]|nr:PmoA family protein [Candidatus Sumerlaeota bacterium]
MAVAVLCYSFGLCAEEGKVEIKKADAGIKYDITIGGKPFTSYIADDDQFFDKPVFYPLLTPAGTQINRSIPPAKGEAQDHPHHQSMWFNYGSVNGIDFWNIQRNGRRIKHRGGTIEGNTLKLTLDWIDNNGKAILEEKKNVTFGAGSDCRWMDHDITLTATGAPVEFGDSKEGAFGIRVAGHLQETGGTGSYINAEGLEKANGIREDGVEKSKGVWGKTSAWVALRGAVAGANGDEPLTLAIFAHPSTHNFPPYWHARDYGLFAVNPWGRHEYDKTQEPRKEILEAGKSVNVHFRVVIYDSVVDKARLDKDYAEFVK